MNRVIFGKLAWCQSLVCFESCIRHKIKLELTGVVATRTQPHHDLYLMVSTTSKKVYILGTTRSGRTFRPSDWAERLAGVMSQFRPGGAPTGRHLAYSPWCVPSSVNNVRCVVVHEDLRAHHVMAWDFVMGFAKDNELQVHIGAPPHMENHLHPKS